MLTQLLTVKTRLGISEFEVKDDAILTNAIKAISGRFDKECNRTLARSVDLVEEFSAEEVELRLSCYPIESVSKFELKSAEAGGWLELMGLEYLVRRGCVVSLKSQLGTWREQARITYTGGYVLPGTTASAGQTALPDDLEQSAIEQVVFWYQNRQITGVTRLWPKGGTYEQFADIDLLPSVRAVLALHRRWSC
jgi:hypothetical protein